MQRKPACLIALLLLPLFATSPAAGEDTSLNSSVAIILGDFLDGYRAYLFYEAVNPGSRADMRGDLFADLDIQLDPDLLVQGKYYPSEARLPRGVKNHLLVVRTINLSEAPVSLWHEAVHHRIRLEGGEECGPEETYMDLQESRIAWLGLLVKFEDQFKATSATDPKACESLVKRWDFLEEKWKGGGQQNLSGPYTWQDTEDASCGVQHKHYQISRSFVQSWDAKLGIRADFEKLRDIYAWKLDRCRELLAAVGTPPAVPPAEAGVSVDDLLQKMRDAAARAASIAGKAQQTASGMSSSQAARDQTIAILDHGARALQDTVSRINARAAEIGQLPRQAAQSSAEIQAACNRVATARGLAREKALEACSSAETLKNSADAAERSRLLPLIQSAAAEAESNARIADSEWNRANQALAQLNQMSGSGSLLSEELRSARAEANRLSSALKPLEEAIVDGEGKIAEISAMAQEIRAVQNESAGYLQEGLKLLSTHPDAQQAAGLRKEFENLYARIQSHASTVASLAAGLENPLAAHANRVRTLSAFLQSVSAGLSGIAEPQWDAGLIAETTTWVDAAELLVEPANNAAANARKCADAAASLQQAPPDRTGSPAAGAADWEAAVGGATVGGSSQGGGASPPSAGQAQADALIRTAQALADAPACDYRSAIQFMEQAAGLHPADPRIAKDLPRMRNLAQKQAFAEQMLSQAYAQIQTDDYDGALGSLRRIEGGPCERARAKDMIAEIENAQTRGASASERDRIAERDRRRREAAAQIRDILTQVQKTMTRQPSAPAPAAPGPTGTGETPPGGQSPGECCSINTVSAPDPVSWGLLLHDAGCKNYMVMGFGDGDDDGMTPQEYARVTNMKLIATGTQAQIQARANSLCSRK
ncbi:MAG: hypothetical protein AB1714_22155 [Acidobacteriota bacterium]